MKRIILFILIVVFCSPGFGGTEEPLTVAGSGDSQAILRKIARLFEERNPGVRIEVPESIGSGGGVQALLHGRVELARTARPLKETEKAGLTAVLFARSPIAFSCHPSLQAITGLSEQEILDIYRGLIRNWKEVGGPDAKIYIIDRETGDSSRKILNRTLPGFQDLDSVAKTFFSTPATGEAIRQHPYTMGYLPLSMAREYNLHIIAVNGVRPTVEAVIDDSYPYVTPFYLVHDGSPSPLALSFLKFTGSQEAKRLMLANDVIPAR